MVGWCYFWHFPVIDLLSAAAATAGEGVEVRVCWTKLNLCFVHAHGTAHMMIALRVQWCPVWCPLFCLSLLCTIFGTLHYARASFLSLPLARTSEGGFGAHPVADAD